VQEIAPTFWVGGRGIIGERRVDAAMDMWPNVEAAMVGCDVAHTPSGTCEEHCRIGLS
jgi:hypothetical protein